MKLIGSILAGATLVIAPAALAQTAPQTTPSPAPSAPAAAAVTSASVTDTEVTQFATAALAVQKIRNDATVAAADKNTKSAEAVTASGLTADRFNAIAAGMQSDTALNTRVQEAAAKLQTPAAATPAATPSPAPGQ